MSVLIVGASGLVGTAAIDTFLDDGWEVVSVSRREPEVFSNEPFTHITLDLMDADACQQVLGEQHGITHVVYAAVFEMPGLIKGWKNPEQMQINLAMLQNVVDPIARSGRLQHVTLLQGTKAYGVHHHPIRVPSREREPRDQHENFYWLQEDFIREDSARHGYEWTIFRPPLIVGPNYGVSMNLLPVIGAYAAMCAHEGRRFSYPGGVSYVAEAVDTRVVADASLWAATSEKAWGEHFNISNGEIFEWRDLWPALGAALGIDVGMDQPMRISEFLTARSGTWDSIVQTHRLRPLTLKQLVGESHHYADFQFAHRAETPPPPALMSTVKLQRAGFHGVCNTEESFRHWLNVLIERKVLPYWG